MKLKQYNAIGNAIDAAVKKYGLNFDQQRLMSNTLLALSSVMEAQTDTWGEHKENEAGEMIHRAIADVFPAFCEIAILIYKSKKQVKP